jgi:peptidoglycan/xylan/chitin deacetylase (PgdA/CDA1 family)
MLQYAPVAVPRIVESYRQLNIKQTFFVPAWCIEQYPEAIEAMLAGGHELAHHGFLHEHPRELSDQEEAYWLDRGIEVIERVSGKRPRGWRAPLYFLHRSADLLAARGFVYDASLMGDDIPYMLDCDRGRLVELPSHWDSDDWPQYVQSMDLDYMMPIRARSRASPSLPRNSRPPTAMAGCGFRRASFATGRLRWEAVHRFLEGVLDRGDVWFAPMEEIAAHVLKVTAEGGGRPASTACPTTPSLSGSGDRRNGVPVAGAAFQSWRRVLRWAMPCRAKRETPIGRTAKGRKSDEHERYRMAARTRPPRAHL